MPSKDSKIISIRVPNRVDFQGLVSIAKLVTNTYDMWRSGGLIIENDEIFVPEVDCEVCNALKVYEEIQEICHDKNVSIDNFLKIAKR
jgi:hypothetical protein